MLGEVGGRAFSFGVAVLEPAFGVVGVPGAVGVEDEVVDGHGGIVPRNDPSGSDAGALAFPGGAHLMRRMPSLGWRVRS